MRHKWHHVNFQAGRIEANLEALFTARGKRVYLVPSQQKYSSHGLQLPFTLNRTYALCQRTSLDQKSTIAAPGNMSGAEGTHGQTSEHRQCHIQVCDVWSMSEPALKHGI